MNCQLDFRLFLKILISIGSTSSEAPKKTTQPKPRDVQSILLTEGMIRLRRQFDYNSRPRKNAIAIVHPETKEVLFPGITKIVPKKDDDNKEVGDQLDEKNKQEQPAEHQIEQFSQYNNIHDIWSGERRSFSMSNYIYYCANISFRTSNYLPKPSRHGSQLRSVPSILR